MKKRISIFGGAFNPPTKGHQQIAELLSEQFDEVWIMPCHNHIYKSGLLSDLDRLNMLNLIKFKSKNIKISTFEIDSQIAGKSYVIMNSLKNTYNDYDFYFVIGSDNANNIKTFYNYDKLLSENKFCIIARKGYDLENLELFTNPENVIISENDIMQVSSTFVRDKIKNNDSDLNEYVDSEVLKYITKYKLYEKN